MNDRKPQLKRLKETTTKVTKPSGLVRDWHTKGVSHGNWKGRAAASQIRLTPPKDVLGGLTDEDLDSKRPSSKESKGWDLMRTNEASISATF